MEYISLTEPEKAELFDEIAALFYKQNFGMASKSEIELLMFHIYLEKMIQQNINADGTLDYNQCSDYRISRELGITPQRVNNLKLRSHMVHPIEFEWEKSFATLIEHAYYDKERQTVIVSIPDPTLMMKIQEEIELKGGFYEKQLNSKLLQMKACYFVQLMAVVEPEATKGELIKAMKQSFKKQAKEDAAFDEKHIGKTILKTAIDISQLLLNIQELVMPQSSIGKAVIKLLTQGAQTMISLNDGEEIKL